ncbi:hypothetical protein [Kitasatospora sp. NPDC088783]|uniref:hypothetical protein n=1 Tax=Kitasatospora sp. NPDC088783 TaxID=3364077 RepID=UPI00380DFF32
MSTSTPERRPARAVAAAVAPSTVLTHEQATGDRQYDYAVSGAFAKNGNFTNEHIDDTGWWALAWLQAYDLTGDTAYPDTTRTATDHMHGYGDGNGTGAQQWSLRTDGTVVNPASGECLDATAHGTPLEIRTCHGGPHRKGSRT